MIDHTYKVEADGEHRLPAAYSQGFAYVRVATDIDPDDPGPLGSSLLSERRRRAESLREELPRVPLEDLLRTD